MSFEDLELGETAASERRALPHAQPVGHRDRALEDLARLLVLAELEEHATQYAGAPGLGELVAHRAGALDRLGRGGLRARELAERYEGNRIIREMHRRVADTGVAPQRPRPLDELEHLAAAAAPLRDAPRAHHEVRLRDAIAA